MSILTSKKTAGFTLVELIVGMTLSLMIMGAILSSYVFLGRNFTRSLGLSSANEPTLESQGRRALTYFTQDVRMASGLDTTGVVPNVVPSAAGMTLILPASSGTKYITYYYNETSTDVAFSTFNIPAQTLVRIDQGSATIQTLHTNLLSLYFRYFDSAGRPYDNSNPPYTTTSNYLSGIKQVSVTFTSQGGSNTNGTLTPVYATASPLLILHNKQLLP